jgi:thiol-disulfide isomerase/thioredoxin
MGRIRAAWTALRASRWGSLAFDVGVILLVFMAIHSWNTRELPSGASVPVLDLARLDLQRSGEGAKAGALPPGETGVVYFFAPWCFYCRNSIDNLESLVRGGDIAWARAVALDYDNLDEVRSFVAKTGWTQPVLLGNEETAGEWSIRAYPTYFVIGPDGRIESRSVGYST